jgi:hypothetical protein
VSLFKTICQYFMFFVHYEAVDIIAETLDVGFFARSQV